MIRVFLVDDHEIVRRGVAELIETQPDMRVVGESGSVRESLGRIAATAPDVAVLDVRLPDGSGVDLCRSIQASCPRVACLVLTAFDDADAAEAAVLAGAAGYVVKDVRAQPLLETIRAVAGGRRLLPPHSGAAVISRIAERERERHLPALTLRERQVLELIAQGMTNRQIGDRLGLAEKTVKNYVSGLLTKLGLERRTQAAVYGADHGLRGVQEEGERR